MQDTTSEPSGRDGGPTASGERNVARVEAGRAEQARDDRAAPEASVDRMLADARALGLDADRMPWITNLPAGELSHVAQLLAALRERDRPPAVAKALSEQEERALMTRLFEDHVGELSADALEASAGVTVEQLRRAVARLAASARALRVIEAAGVTDVHHAAFAEARAAAPHYVAMRRVAVGTGVADALEAEGRVVFQRLRAGFLSTEHLDLLVAAGESRDRQVLETLLREAGEAARRELRLRRLADLLKEGEGRLATVPTAPKRTWLRGIGQLLSGAAQIAADIVTPLAATTIQPAAAVAPGLLTSCGAGVGTICEGIATLRGD